MKYWLYSRHLTLAAGMCLLVPVLLLLASGRDLPVFLSPPFAAAVPLAPMSALLVTAPAGLVIALRTTPELVAVRSVRVIQTVTLAAMASLPAAMCMLVQIIGWSDYGSATARNCLAFVGLTMMYSVFTRRNAALWSAGTGLVISTFGRALDREPERWAWSIAAADNGMSWVWCAGLMIAGVTATFVGTNSSRAAR
ncbi:hypothetical protein D1871_19490 [Nakamurella silvestris]|nr:hypothetical protein D1871_19490 [Nakamurella silvestris]